MVEYDDVLFAVSFYLLDDEALGERGVELAKTLDADVHLLSLTLERESEDERAEHRREFDSFAESLRDEGLDVTAELREDDVGYDEVADEIADATEDHDLVMMGHTRVRDPSAGTTADELINTVSKPVVVIPLETARFRGP